MAFGLGRILRTRLGVVLLGFFMAASAAVPQAWQRRQRM